MPITKFKITQAPLRATIEINGSPFILNYVYPISQQTGMKIIVDDISEPFDSFKYKLGNQNSVWSNNINVTVNALVDAGTPELANIDVMININQNNNITSEFVLDNDTDRIMFTEESTEIFGQLLINGNPIVINQLYYRYELTNIIFQSIYGGSTPNVLSQYKFVVGNKNEWSTEYQLNLTAKANLFGVSFSLENESLTQGTLTTA